MGPDPLSPSGSALGSVVIDTLLIATLIVGFCNWSMFCCALLCVHSSFSIILMGKRESWLFRFCFVFLVSRDCCVALHHIARGLSAVCDVVFPDRTHLRFLKVVEI